MRNQDSTTVVLADDHHLVRSALKRLFKRYAMEVIADVADGNEALRAVELLKPDLAILDLAMPGMEGYATIRAIAATSTRVLVLTGMENSVDSAMEAMRAGARGFVLKASPVSELLHAIRCLKAGEMFIDRGVTSTIVSSELAPAAPGLSERELEVLRVVGRGVSNEEAGRILGITPATVRTHIGNISKVLGLRSRVELVIFSLCSGVVAVSDLRSSARPIKRARRERATAEA